MIRLRPFKLNDTNYLLEWIDTEEEFVKWCANKFQYPLTREQIEEYYHRYEEDDNGWIMIALNEEGIPVGHFLMCKADYEKNSIHLGFIVINSKMRGHGYGKEMVSKAIKYAFESLNMERVTLAVFDNNLAARNCYQTVGFIDEMYRENSFPFKNQKWGCYDMIISKSNK